MKISRRGEEEIVSPIFPLLEELFTEGFPFRTESLAM